MDILESDWLIHMLKKSGKTPQVRLLSFFSILDDWSNAPGLKKEFYFTQSKSNILVNAEPKRIQAFLSLEAAKAGAAQPEILASQLYFMALSATQEKLLGNNVSGLQHAKSAADALIKSHTKKEFRIAKSSAYAIAASFLGIATLATVMLTLNQWSQNTLPTTTASKSVVEPAFVKSTLIASPESTSALVAQIEQMRHGDCQLIEALQLPDSYKKVYFENIVLGQISTVPSEQTLVRELLSKIRCNYTPALMKKST